MAGMSRYFGRRLLLLSSIVLSFSMAGCSYSGFGNIEEHFQEFGARPPRNNSVTVCSGYGCRTQTNFRFTAADLKRIQALMSGSRKTNTPGQEREAVALTLAWMEKRVGDAVGTSADRPGDDIAGVGDPTQMDCVDVATNLASYLLILQRNGLLKHHEVGTVYVKENITRGFEGWTHYAAIIVDRSGQKYAVDGWKLASGIPPEIVEVERWYIDNKDIAYSQ
jgi:hypothetical protein